MRAALLRRLYGKPARTGQNHRFTFPGQLPILDCKFFKSPYTVK